MIRRLRRRHRLAILALAIALPVLLWSAIRARRPRPEADRLPPPAAAEGIGR